MIDRAIARRCWSTDTLPVATSLWGERSVVGQECVELTYPTYGHGLLGHLAEGVPDGETPLFEGQGVEINELPGDEDGRVFGVFDIIVPLDGTGTVVPGGGGELLDGGGGLDEAGVTG